MDSSSQRPVADRGTLVKLLARSKLLSDDRLRQLDGPELLSHDGEELLRALVAKNWVTPWQSQELQKGRYRFFIGDYLLLELVARGGMGTVYKARHPVTAEQVAVKTLARQFRQNARSIARFKREIRAVRVLNHPNVVRALDAGEVEGVLFLVMEYFPGRSLQSWLNKSEQLSVVWVCDCIRQAALGLQHAHEHGLIHRDINAANVLVHGESLAEPPELKILDFGLAHIDEEDESTLTRDDQIMGSVDYMAPEQARHIREIDIRADIFSLGVIAFELLTGRLPLPGKTVIEKLMVRASEDAPPVSEFREGVPREVEAIVRGMLARKVEDRYQMPSHVASAIAPYSFAAADAEPTTEDSVAITAMATVERAAEVEDEASPFDEFLHEIAKAPPSQISRERNPNAKVGEVSRPPRERKQTGRSGRAGPRLDGSLWNRFLDQNLYVILGGAAILALTILFLILG